MPRVMKTNMRIALWTAPLSVILSGCSSASAATVDPKSDVHCSVLAFYFHGLAKHEGAPADQVAATKGLHDWYAIKMKEVAGERFKDAAVFLREVEPILDAVKADPLSMRDEASACADRAAADPTFNRFASGYRR